MTPELPQLPAGDGPVAGMLVSEGLCPWCGSDLIPPGAPGREIRSDWPAFGWCEVDEMGWSLTIGSTEPTTWWADEVDEMRSATQVTLAEML